jgi:hypothetical protein
VTVLSDHMLVFHQIPRVLMSSRANVCVRVVCLLVLSEAMVIIPASGQSIDSSTASRPVVVGGFVDAYYCYNFADPQSSFNQLRNFDVTHNQFVVSTAEVSVTKAASPVGFRVDLDFGPTNDITQSNAAGSIANAGQAYVTYVAPLGRGITIDAGKFVTHMGIEVIKAKDDYNYSRSLLFSLSIPYYHLGVRASYPVSDAFTLNTYLLNCYNGVPTNGRKTFGLEGTLAATSTLTITGNWIGGPALPDSISKSFRNVVELIAALQATDRLMLALDGVYGQDNLPSGTVLWKGVAAYTRCALGDPSTLTLRAEVYQDPQGFTSGVSQVLQEGTLTYEYKGLANLLLRAEYRYDWSDAVVYDGSAGRLTRRNQSTLSAGAIVLF